ncbi:MAG: hypothetical protein NTX73_10940 [Rhodobacterales bacterium]|nr:hypothetical protein [Rhodobacterales bacterium]
MLSPITIMSTGPDEHGETMRVLRILKKALIYASLVSVALIVALFLVFIAAGLLLPSKPVQSEEASTYEGLIRTLKNDGVLDQVVRIDCERLGPESETDDIDFYIRCEATLKNNAGTYVRYTSWAGGFVSQDTTTPEEFREAERLRSERLRSD